MARPCPAVFLADFGLAKDTLADSGVTRSGAAVGTPAYLSPEAARGELAALTPAADVWGLGCIAYELLARTRAFCGDTPAAQIGAVLTTAPPWLRAAPRPVARFVAACLQRDAGARPQAADAVRDDCRRLLAGETPRARVRARWRRPAAVVTAIAALAVAGLAAVVAGTGGPAPPAGGASAAEALANEGWRQRQDDPVGAADRLARACALDPARHDWRVQLGVLRWALDGAGAAIAEWSRVPDESPASTRAWWLRGLAATLEQIGQFRMQRATAGRPAWERAAAGTGPERHWAAAGLAMLDYEFAGIRAALEHADGWDAALLLGLSEEGAKNPHRDEARAITAYTRALDGGAPVLWIRLNRAVLQIRAGRLAEAEADLQEVARRHPDHFALMLNRAELHRARGDEAAAWAENERVIALHPERPEGWANRAVDLVARGDPRGALAAAEEAMARDADQPLSLQARARARELLGDAAGALADVDRALELDPRFADALFERGVLRRARGDAAGALADVEAFLALRPRSASGYNTRGNLRLDASDVPGALADFDRAVALLPGRPALHFNRGNGRVRAGDLVGALADFDAALTKAPDLVDARIARATARELAGDRAGAADDYAHALTVAPEHLVGRINRGAFRLRGGDISGALRDFEAARARAPERPEPWLYRAGARLAQADLAGAVEDARRAVALGPECADAHLVLGNVLVYRQEWAEAARCYRTFLALRPNDPQAAVARQTLAACEARIPR